MAPKLRKAARGKHRWIGIHYSGVSGRDNLEKVIVNCVGSDVIVKLLDIDSFAVNTCIIKVSLKSYPAVRESLESQGDGVLTSITSSGKLRLVRERLGIHNYAAD